MEGVSLGISKLIPGAWASKLCDTCKSTTALLFCRTHSLFLCLPCDSNLHAPAHAPPHARVGLCEVCENAPAMVICKADNDAALCAACDSDIHSANPLARRHLRRPVTPFFATPAAGIFVSGDDVAAGISIPDDDVATGLGDRNGRNGDVAIGTVLVGDDVAMTWRPEWSPKVEADVAREKCLGFSFCDLDFDGIGTEKDSVVPVHVQTMKRYEEATTQQIINQLSSKYNMEIDFTNSKLINSIDHCPTFMGQSISQSISSSSMDVGVVPDGSSLSDISYPYAQTCSTFGSTGTTASHGSDREARVMRYREKRKNRKFEKTIRYASRKAYAETRPRIKGRFAKRSVTEPELMNQMLIPNTSAFMADIVGYGIVPSF